MGEGERVVTDSASGTHGSRGRLSPCLRTVTTAWVFTMDTEWRAAPHRGQGERLPWPEKKANPDWSWQENSSARGLPDPAWARGADWLPTRPWPPPGCLTVGQLGHPGLHLSLRVPVGTDWPHLAHGGGASTSGSESSMNKDPEIGPRVTRPGRRAEGRLRSCGGGPGGQLRTGLCPSVTAGGLSG